MDISKQQLFPKNAFGEHLTQARTRLKLSQEALAEAVGTTSRSISRWEHNQAIPQQYYRDRLCEVLQTTPEALFGANSEEPSRSAIASAPLWYVPYARNPYFTGREAILHQLHERLHTERQVTVTQSHIVSGLGGIGKTQTVLEYSYRYRSEYQAVLWVGAETAETLMSDYIVLAHLFHLPEKDGTNQSIVRTAVNRWFLSHSDWLLVFDNVEDLNLLQTVLPDASQGHILITTRSQIVGTLGSHFDLQKMERVEGVLFLLRRAKFLRPDASLETASATLRIQAETLVDLLDGLPLALDQAGAYIEEAACSLSDYLERYASRRPILLNSRGTIDHHHSDSVTATLSLAVQKVEQVSPVATNLLRLCALLHAEAIPEEFFTQNEETLGPLLQSLAYDPLSLDIATKQLRRFSLIQRDPETKTFHIHRLLQAIILDGMNEEERKLWIEQIIQILLEVFPNYENIELSHMGGIQPSHQKYLPHALKCAELIKTWQITSEEAGTLLYRIGCYLQKWGNSLQAIPLLLQALHIAEKPFGREHVKVAFYLSSLAYLYIDAEKLAEAEACFQQALDIREKLLGSQHLEVAENLRGLARLFCHKGMFTQALSLAQRALAINETIMGIHHYQVALALNIVGVIYTYQGEYAQAEHSFHHALNIYRETLGQDHFFLASCLNNLGSLQALQGRFPQGVPFYEKTLQICEKRLGQNHEMIADVMKRLGYGYFVQKRYSQAQTLYQRALSIYQKLPESNSFQAAYTLIDLGELSFVQGHILRAKRFLRRAFIILGETVSIDQLDDQKIAHCLVFAADHLHTLGHLTEARIYYQRILTLELHTLELDHPLIQHCLRYLETKPILANALEQDS